MYNVQSNHHFRWSYAGTGRMTKDEQKQNTSPNRKKFIKLRVNSDLPVGLLAYNDDAPIAWCSVAPRDTHQRLKGDENLENVWSITCFYIKKEFRDQGLIDRLIEQAINYAKTD